MSLKIENNEILINHHKNKALTFFKEINVIIKYLDDVSRSLALMNSFSIKEIFLWIKVKDHKILVINFVLVKWSVNNTKVLNIEIITSQNHSLFFLKKIKWVIKYKNPKFLLT